MVEKITSQNFQKIIDKEKPTIIDFWAEWCTPCRILSPIFEELSNEIKTADFYKLNIEEEQELANKFEVMSIPTLVIMKNGKEIERIIGFSNKGALKAKLLSKI
ncbi:MAG: thioredoxin [Nanoarchaeota archaeon]